MKNSLAIKLVLRINLYNKFSDITKLISCNMQVCYNEVHVSLSRTEVPRSCVKTFYMHDAWYLGLDSFDNGNFTNVPTYTESMPGCCTY